VLEAARAPAPAWPAAAALAHRSNARARPASAARSRLAAATRAWARAATVHGRCRLARPPSRRLQRRVPAA
jgi:hypothetical protein